MDRAHAPSASLPAPWQPMRLCPPPVLPGCHTELYRIGVRSAVSRPQGGGPSAVAPIRSSLPRRVVATWGGICDADRTGYRRLRWFGPAPPSLSHIAGGSEASAPFPAAQRLPERSAIVELTALVSEIGDPATASTCDSRLTAVAEFSDNSPDAPQRFPERGSGPSCGSVTRRAPPGARLAHSGRPRTL